MVATVSLVNIYCCCCCLITKLCPTLCNLMDCSLPGSSVHGIAWQEYWSGLSFPPPGDLPNPRIVPTSPALAGGFFTTEPPDPDSYQISNLIKETIHKTMTHFLDSEGKAIEK